MDLSGLSGLIERMPSFARLREGLKGGGGGEIAALEAAKPYVIAALYRNLRMPMLVLSARPEDAKRLYEQISAWLGDGRVRYFPEPDALPYERIAPDASTELERIQVLSGLVNCSSESIPPLVVTSAPALMGKTASHTDFASTCHSVMAGLDIEPFDLLRKWEAMGYRMESMVEVPGTMSHRGGIIDIYPPTSEQPARLEFFGNTVESLRLFDPISQRSVRQTASISVSPATELLAPLLKDRTELEKVTGQLDLSRCTAEVCGQFKEALDGLLAGQRPREVEFYGSLFSTDGVLDYLPAGTMVVLDEPSNLEQAVGQLGAEAEQLRSDFEARGELAGNFPRPYFEWPELEARMKGRQRLLLTAFGENHLEFSSASSFGGQVLKFIEQVKELKDGKRLIIISPQANRLSELFEEADILVTPQPGIKQPPAPGSITLLPGSLAEGWVMQHETHLFTDAEIFGFVKQRRLVKKRPVAHHKLFVDLVPGDFVVHVEHGIAKFIGVSTLTGTNGSKEYLLLQYGSGDKLYVPTDQIDRVNRYVGASDRPPVLSRLGTLEWNRTKQRAKEAAEALAKELLALYATREVVPGYAFSRDTVWQQELEGSFPYVETPDQMQAQTDVKADMEKPKPMDRLVCGDVGYGKTEVAIRAAFKAVMDGKQVAVLVPTTVLAEQHYITFNQRMKAFPIKVEVLSRFKSAREQRAILEGVANGSVDICIGTHRLLQKDVKFKDLGLLIIDEEQRFGVAHKEHFKKVRQEVDVLSLSATPIPRTLHMSLVGVRDMSTMETPPEERLPIKTYVAEYNDR
ncbi:MAG: CarD family transcriptional regulator, partial [Dehalococcoidales bacterium]|nr:CarD family transcriptional regulator [Dehalococcoidales bacterium]